MYVNDFLSDEMTMMIAEEENSITVLLLLLSNREHIIHVGYVVALMRRAYLDVDVIDIELTKGPTLSGDVHTCQHQKMIWQRHCLEQNESANPHDQGM